ncbi:MAG TPA: hypothetical protein VG099_15985 [Gemmataceae bacterium]|nr:hypothetical protein [Gemmataceae bacterium]
MADQFVCLCGGQAGHWNLKALSHLGVVNAEWHGQPVVAVLDRASTTPRGPVADL